MVQDQAILEVKNLRTYFYTETGVVRSVDDVSFTVGRGETVGIVGESGCGKTVTSLSIMGLLQKPGRIAGGSIYLEKTDITELSPSEMRKLRGNKISMIFQEPLTSLNPLFRVGHQIAEAIRTHSGLSGKAAKEKAVEWMRRVGIPGAEEKYYAFPHQLSGGMRQRVMIAMALSCEPKVVIADEPTTALDVTIQAQILKLLKELSKGKDMAVILITHDLGVVAEMCDKIIVMYAGQVVEQADVYTLFRTPKHPYTQGLLQSTPNIRRPDMKLVSIDGVVPPPDRMPAGCRFHPRCAFAEQRCISEAPPLISTGEAHEVRCWLAAEERGAAG